jgi:hypothetical protein
MGVMGGRVSCFEGEDAGAGTDPTLDCADRARETGLPTAIIAWSVGALAAPPADAFEAGIVGLIGHIRVARITQRVMVPVQPTTTSRVRRLRTVWIQL